jgi:flagellar biosynthetic protein FliQ
MTPETVMSLGQQALTLTVMIAAPMLLSALAVGLLVGMIQAATQINEMTLSFIPKLLILVLAIALGGPWMMRTMLSFTRQLYHSIPSLIG